MVSDGHFPQDHTQVREETGYGLSVKHLGMRQMMSPGTVRWVLCPLSNAVPPVQLATGAGA